MTLDSLSQDTIVTYPGGDIEGRATILAVLPVPERDYQLMVIVDKTPVHPRDHRSPDQPADQGYMMLGDQRIELRDCLTAAKNPETNEVFLDQGIPKDRKKTAGWPLFVAHIVDKAALDADAALGQSVGLFVDANFRNKLSYIHSLSHMASLALNKAVNDCWKKPARKDSQGNNDFDGTAIDCSRIFPDHGEDRYRLGNSLRRQFQIDEVLGNLEKIQSELNKHLQAWLNFSSITANIMPAESRLSDRRMWKAKGNGFFAKIPCGGTHLERLDALRSAEVILSREGADGLLMTTRPA